MTIPASNRVIAVGDLLADPAKDGSAGPALIDVAAGRIRAVAAVRSDQLSAAERALVAMPAPANAHDHGRGLKTLAFGALDDTLEIWLSALGQEPVTDPYLRAGAAFARLAEGGVAAANHCHNAQRPDGLVEEAEAVSRAARDVGIRIAFAVPVMDRNPVVYGDIEPLLAELPEADRAGIARRGRRATSIDEALRAVDEIAAFEHDTFQVQYGPVGPQWVSDRALAAIADASAGSGRRIHMHLFETKYQREWADAAYPGGLIKRLDEIGLLSPRLTVAHGVWLTEAECELLAERGVTVSVNTSSNLRLRAGIAPVARFLKAGLRFGMGLDGMAFDDDEDALREIRLHWQMHRGFGGEDVLTADRLFRAVTIDGRRSILGEDGGGRIAPGAPADFIVLDRTAMTADVLDGVTEISDLLLTRMTRQHLKTLVVAGRTIVENGSCVTVDRTAIESVLLDEARAGWCRSPPDHAAHLRLKAALRRYYACGCHRRVPEPVAS